MNLVLFESGEIDVPLSHADERARHLINVLRRRDLDPFEVGEVNGRKGQAEIIHRDDKGLHLRVRWDEFPPPRPGTRLLVALPRPQTARDILRDATTLGVAAIDFVASARSDPNYARSSLWHTGEWRRHLLIGAAQACATHIPMVTWHHSLTSALRDAPESGPRWALNPYATAPANPTAAKSADAPCLVAIGPERGWDDVDLVELCAARCQFWSLGPRILRTETAVIAALTQLNCLRPPA